MNVSLELSHTIIALDRRSNINLIEKEWKYTFIHEVLESMGIPMDDIWQEPILTANQKLRLVSLLNNYDIFIYDDIDGNVEILHKKELVAKWIKPSYVLRRDISELDQDKSVYLEMTTNYWSLYHQEPNDQ